MKRLTLSLPPICLALWTIPGASAMAQQPRTDSAAVANATRTLKSDLRNYVRAQEQYYGSHSTYAGTAAATTLKPSPGTTVVWLTFSPKGHNAVAIHRDLPGLVCAIWVGDHAPPLDDKAKEGEPTCRIPG